MNTVDFRYWALGTVGKLLSTVPLILLGLAPASADVTLADFVRALKGVTGASVEVVRTPIYDSTGCGVDEKVLRTAIQTHAERSGFRLAEEGTAQDLTLAVSVLHYRVMHTSECTASVELTLRTDTEYNGTRLPLTIWSQQALMTVNKGDLSKRVGDQVEVMLITFVGLLRTANQ